jgi:hypothetical protein
MSEHWDDDALIRRLYGIGPQDGHLDECLECAQRWEAMSAVRKGVLEPPRTPEVLLAAQRRAIYDRLEQPPIRLALVPAALATAALVLAAVLLHKPAPQNYQAQSDAALMADVYSLVQSDEPRAVEPIHALFEANQ